MAQLALHSHATLLPRVAGATVPNSERTLAPCMANFVRATACVITNKNGLPSSMTSNGICQVMVKRTLNGRKKGEGGGVLEYTLSINLKFLLTLCYHL